MTGKRWSVIVSEVRPIMGGHENEKVPATLRIVYFMLRRDEPYRSGDRCLSMRKFKRLERRALSGLQA